MAKWFDSLRSELAHHRLGVVLALVVALTGCVTDTWSSRVEEPDLGPEPPEHLLRRPPDFRIYEAHIRKEFFLYFYEDESVQEEIVTVINHALPSDQRRPRLATREEHDYAIGIFMEDWRSRGQEDKIRYFNERHALDTLRKNSLIDQKIHFKEEEIKELDERKVSLDADLKSRQATGTYAGGDAKFLLTDSATVQRELAKTERLLLISRGQLMLLEYLRSQRDAQFARHAVLLVENEMDVPDLLEQYGQPERLIADIRQNVAPQTWDRPNARIDISGSTLRVIQSRDVIIAVRDYVEQLRILFKDRKKPVKTAEK